MPLQKKIRFSHGLIGIWRFTETLTDLLPEFSDKELIDPLFANYTHDKRKLEWLATRLLLREMIGSDFSISYLPSGKPLLNHKLFRKISITHSRDFVAIIVHESKNVGIDIENRKRDFRRIEKRFLSVAELNFVKENEDLKCLFWCAKEAVFKLVEEEGIEFKEQILVRPNREHEDQLLATFISKDKNTDYQLSYDYFADNYLVWVAD